MNYFRLYLAGYEEVWETKMLALRRWTRVSLYLAIGFLAAGNFAAPGLAQKQLSKHAAKELKKQSKREADAMSRFAERAGALLANSPVAKGSWGLLIVDPQSGETLFERDADRYFLPASNMKLFSTALALAKLGPEYRFHTTVETNGLVSEAGVLSGDLFLVGRGDANLSNRKFPYELKEEFDGAPDKALAELADAVAAKGIKQISGDVVGDDSYFPRERYPSGWEIDDMVWEYGAAISALAVNDNVVTVTLAPGENIGDPAVVLMQDTPDFVLKNETITSAAGVKADLTLTREPGAAVVVIRGTLPATSTSRKLQLAVEEPAQHAAALFKRLLEARGIAISGAARAVHEPMNVGAQRAMVAEHLSLPLIEDIRLTNKISQNLHAELLLRTAARQVVGPWNTAEDLGKFAGDFYAAVGITPGDVFQTDGSGLSEHDLATPRAMVALLSYARTQPWFPVYYASLPVSGVDGTLTERMKTPPTLGRIHAKTGSLAHVRTLSGYAETLDGRVLIFSIFGNALTGKSHEGTDAIDGLCRAMVEEFSDKTSAATKKNHRN